MFKIGLAQIGVVSIKDASGVKIGSANCWGNHPIRFGNAIDEKKYMTKKYTVKMKREKLKLGGMKIFAEILQGSTVIGEVRGDLVGESVISLDGKVAAKVTYLSILQRKIEIVGGVDSAFVVMVVHAFYHEYMLQTNEMHIFGALCGLL
jgi:hypothetical protein